MAKSRARNMADIVSGNYDVPISSLDNVAVTPAAVSDQANTSTGYFQVPQGSTAQRPGSLAVGMVRYNATTGRNEVYDSLGWTVIAAPPEISSISPSNYNGEQGTSFTITGAKFESGAVVKFLTAAGLEYSAASVSVVSATSITATTPQDFTVADGPLAVKVVNPTGLSAQLDGCINTGSSPVFTVGAGSLGTYISGASVSHTLSATDADAGATVSYSINSGSLPSGITLNTSTGVISGTASNTGTADSTSSFTLAATDNAGNVSLRTYSLTIRPNITLPSAYQALVTGTVYYVNASSGSDNNNGTSRATAFGTIAKAMSVAADSSVVVLSPETHYITGTPAGQDIYAVAQFAPNSSTGRTNVKLIGYPGLTYICYYTPGTALRDFHFAAGGGGCTVYGCVLERDLSGGSEGLTTNYMTAIFGMNNNNYGGSSGNRLAIQNCVIKNCAVSPTKRPGGTNGYDKWSWNYDNNNDSYARVANSLIYGGGAPDWMSSYSGTAVESNYNMSNFTPGTSGVSNTGAAWNVSIDTSFWGRSGSSKTSADSGGAGLYSGTYSWQNASYSFSTTFYGNNWS